MRNLRCPLHRAALALFGAAGLASHACAAVFTVGNPVGPGQCTHGTIQSAFNAAESNPGADTVRLTRSLTYEPEANSISTNQELTVEGGFATCTQATADIQKTIVSGVGGATEPVFRITVNTGGSVRLRRLQISGGDEDGSGRGGGIYFRGNGVLEIRDSLITDNLAGSGGGIYAEGTGSDAELVIGADVVISNNRARYDGGGIVADQVEMSMLEPGSSLLRNEALGLGGSGGYGGGLYLRAGTRSSYAYIGSGAAVFGPVWGNRALYGGGVAIGGAGSNFNDSETARLRLSTTEAGRPARITNNVATVAGGGLYLKSFDSVSDGSVGAGAHLWNASIDGNAAPDGAAAYVHGDPGGVLVTGRTAYLYFNTGDAGLWWPAEAVPCAQGIDCGGIKNNDTVDSNNQPTNGAVIRLNDRGEVRINAYVPSSGPPQKGGVTISGNRGGSLFHATGASQHMSIDNALITGNTSSLALVRNTASGLMRVVDTTIADNTIGASPMFSTSNADVTIARSVLWHPGLVMLGRSGGSQSVTAVLASETGSLGGMPEAVLANPRFIDPEHGDYRLRAGSPAVDFAAAVSGDDRDVFGLPRDQDLPIKANVRGVRDAGAFERQSLLPLVLNADFDFSDLRLWTHLAGSWDGSQNAVGVPGSGSWSYSGTGLSTTRVVLGRQCIHLPGPGRYRLNGRGRAGGNTMITRDYAVLAWEFRRTGTEPCNFGPADAFGELTVGSGTSWGQAAAPAIINVGPADWSPTSSITVSLVAVDGGIVGPPSVTLSAWFDGITLEVDGSDVIFADDFEAP